MDNPSFIGDNPSIPGEYKRNYSQFYPGKHYDIGSTFTPSNQVHPKKISTISNESEKDALPDEIPKTPHDRDSWGKGIEFLLSCIAMSVGLGNVWRFPFIALKNGGGAFVIPYIIVLILVGKPIYFMEMLIGQFSSRGSVKVYDFSPAMRGVAFGQIVSIGIVATYYASLMALTLKYFYESFNAVLPWGECNAAWSDVNCVASNEMNKTISTNSTGLMIHSNKSVSSAELYFYRDVLKEKASIEDGIGYPDLTLMIMLTISWTMVFLTLLKGIKSSGKAAYFLAIFPYIVLSILLLRAVTLEGSMNGIIYFLKPQWKELLNPKVWYEAVTQVFFSLSVCFGNIIMYSSYNKFGHNVYRDATIVTTLDTFTSLLAGCAIFGILGHLAHEIGTDDIANVVKGGAGLAFISYPEAIAKFTFMPQAFSVLFFLMLFILGIGTNIAQTSCLMTVITDQFPKVKNWYLAAIISVLGIALGSIYVTPGGQFVLTLVDYFGASFIVFILAIGELIAFGWIYGVDRLCADCEFMLGFRPSLYWRICWKYVTPGLMTVILIYAMFNLKPVTYNDLVYPDSAYAVGWCIVAFGLIQLPLFTIYAVIKAKGDTKMEKFKNAFRPKENWGPREPARLQKYKEFMASRD